MKATAVGPQFCLRRAESNDGEALMHLASQIHGEQRSREHWEWKYLRNPAGPILTSVAESDGQLVGQIGSFPAQFVLDGETHTISQEVDIFVDENHRHGSTFIRLANKRVQINAESNVHYSYGITIAVTSKISEKVLKCRKVAPVPRMVKPLDTKQFLRGKMPVPLADLASVVANRLMTIVPRGWDALPKGTQLEPITRFDQRFDDLWQRVEGDYKARVVKNAQFLNWRYIDIPDEKYEVMAIVEEVSKKVLGFIVIGCRAGQLNRGRVVDLVTPRSDDGGLTRPLLAHALRRFHENGMTAAICWMFPHCHVHPLLVQAGFHPRETPGHDVVFRVMPHVEEPAKHWEAALDPANWYIVQGDSDDY